MRRFGATRGCSPHARDVSLGASVGAKADIYPAQPMLRSGWVKALLALFTNQLPVRTHAAGCRTRYGVLKRLAKSRISLAGSVC